MVLGTTSKILLGRLLTRSGDQAWDFAVPLVLLQILPGQLKLASLYYLLVRFAHVLLLPRFAGLIDKMSRPTAVRIGLISQVVGVSLSAAGIYGLTYNFWTFFFILVVAGIIGAMGSAFMEIAIANDLVPSTVHARDLGRFNSRLRQVDLLTEVTVPVVTGLILLATSHTIPMFGFAIIILWNLISFIPEYFLLTSVFKSHPELIDKIIVPAPSIKTSLIVKLTSGWRSFLAQPIAPAVCAYALLWLSVLSPHGVLLTAYLKDGWQLPEWLIGTFRGLGALFGLIATLSFPWITRRLGLVRGSQFFLLFQFAMVGLALFCFLFANDISQILFLVFILLSRIGLYGFSLGEMEIRQTRVADANRGQINGFASALTGVATLVLYGAGAMLPSTHDFLYLIVISVSAVGTAGLVYSLWVRRSP